MVADVRSLFVQRFGSQPAVTARAPGRVNLLGEHVDYNDGPVLPAAIDRRVFLAAAPTPDKTAHLLAHDLGEEVVFQLDSVEKKIDREGRDLPPGPCIPPG